MESLELLRPLFEWVFNYLSLDPVALKDAVIPILGVTQVLKTYTAARWPKWMSWVRPGIFWAWATAIAAAYAVQIEGAAPEALTEPLTWVGFVVAAVSLYIGSGAVYKVAMGKGSADPTNSIKG